MRVLLVGFKADRCHSLVDWLASWNIKISMAADTDAAITAIAQASHIGKAFHAVLVHANSCLENCLFIPAQFNLHASPEQPLLILCVAGNDAATTQSLLAAGFSYMLPLPLDKRLLFNALHASVKKYERRDGVTSLSEYYASKEIVNQVLRILVAEDCSTNRVIIKTILERAGHQVKVVEDGACVLDEVQRESYDILILDMHMPNMGGLDVIKALRFLQLKEEEIPIIVWSAEATKHEIEECKALGVETFLPKPIVASQLVVAIGMLTNKQREETVKQVLDATPIDQGDKQMIDLSTLTELETFSTDSGFVPELIHAFITDNDLLLKQMESTLNSSRIEDFKDLLHGMKGSAASIGADQLADLCSEVISTDQKKIIADSARTMNRISQTLASTYAALAEYLKNRQSAAV